MSELPDPDSFGDYADWPGREVHGPAGRIGTVREIYLDDATDRPEWVLVDLEEGCALRAARGRLGRGRGDQASSTTPAP